MPAQHVREVPAEDPPLELATMGHVDARCHHQPEPQIAAGIYLMCSRRGAERYTLARDFVMSNG